MNFEKSGVFCTKKCGCQHLKSPSLVHKMSALDNPPEYGRLLWTAPYAVNRITNQGRSQGAQGARSPNRNVVLGFGAEF